MREILFRGKRVDNGKWVEGFYVSVPEHYKPEMSGKSYIVSINNGLFFEVIPETIGQFTGKTDDNNVKIFENDIVNTYTVSLFPGSKKSENSISYVIWNNEEAEYQLKTPGLYTTHSLNRCFGDRIEVIGNLYNNLELLER